MKQKTGRFFGVGVGPGDPELISLKAVRILRSVHTIFAAASSANTHSIAMKIAAPHLPDGTPVIRLSFPMTSDRNALRQCWKQNTSHIVEELEKGRDAAFITLGDPLTYSTYGYIVREMKTRASHVDIRTIPGIASYQAAAARINVPLAEGEESLLILSGAKGGEHLRRLGSQAENIVMLKTYRSFQDIHSAIEEMDLVGNTVCISSCGQPDERITTDIRKIKDAKQNYLTMLIIKNDLTMSGG
ncbi:MAG: precorrin-2 C(20)-methyltransferase [Desulfobacterales bacterium C00003106]|jgi:precorrin-2/cobalt-factor-2 C20-methyltransferase|nr:precorrin-2 C(20)-methyltransferase [Desulfobacterales bacterium]MDL1977165.1 precorrin-2 C(20)-methyltransferase [Deltaproteobacteria bacterium]OEU52228.1 MAG: precorrin-2 C(20)-methyltransferase [Desulfobacterales bacterium C00003106]OEU59437.1 MAG: precorrin-2 C(20)-methyltransferase [Desulfobacterales bacterium C00003104]